MELNNLEEYKSMYWKEFITFEEYKTIIEQDDADEVECINDALLMADSFERGKLLFQIIFECDNAYIKYYLLIKWWSMIDYGHNLFTPELVTDLFEETPVILDLSSLECDDEGYVTIYRGENKHSFSYKCGALSWTTSTEVAAEFARGSRIKTTEAANPRLIKGKVHKKNILAKLDDRDEFELLCKNVVVIEEIYL